MTRLLQAPLLPVLCMSGKNVLKADKDGGTIW